MGINQFDQRPDSNPKPLDWGFLLQAQELAGRKNAMAEDAYDKTLGALNTIPALPQDIPVRNERIKSYQDKLDSWHNNYSSDLKSGIPELRALQREFSTDITRGPLGAIAGSYSARQAQEKEVHDLYDKQKIDQSTRQKLLDQDLNNYKGIGQGDEYGRFNSYQGRTPAEQRNLVEEGDKIAKGWAAEKIVRGGYKGYDVDQNGALYFINNKGEHEYADPTEIRNAVSQGLQQDTKNTSFVDQQLELNYPNKTENGVYGERNGQVIEINPEALKENTYGQAADIVASKYGFNSTSNTQSDLSWNPYRLAKYKQGLKDSPSLEPQTLNLNSVRIPQSEGLEINVPSKSGSGYSVPWTDEEIRKIHQENPDPKAAEDKIGSGKPMGEDDVKKIKLHFSSEQEKVIQRAQREFGEVPGNDIKKGELLNKYIKYHNEKLTMPGLEMINTRDDKAVKEAKHETEDLFTNMNYVNRNFKLISGEGEKELTGTEFSNEYGKKEFIKKVAGNISPDNPYQVSGRVINVFDKDGKKISTYAMSGTDQEETQDVQKRILHEMYQAKYSPTGESIVHIPHADGSTGTYTLHWEDVSHQLDNNKHYPIVTGSSLVLTDEKGHKVSGLVVDNTPGTDPIKQLYSNLTQE